MQYTASSFAQVLVGLSASVLHPRERRPRVGRLFPRRGRYGSHVHDVVLEEWVVPAVALLTRQVARLRVIQAGHIQLYILYILLIVIALVVSVVPLLDLLRSLVTR